MRKKANYTRSLKLTSQVYKHHMLILLHHTAWTQPSAPWGLWSRPSRPTASSPRSRRSSWLAATSITSWPSSGWASTSDPARAWARRPLSRTVASTRAGGRSAAAKTARPCAPFAAPRRRRNAYVWTFFLFYLFSLAISNWSMVCLLFKESRLQDFIYHECLSHSNGSTYQSPTQLNTDKLCGKGFYRPLSKIIIVFYL